MPKIDKELPSQEFLDETFPVLEEGSYDLEQLIGEWSFPLKEKTFRPTDAFGQIRHGPSLICWMAGQPFYCSDVLLVDGTRTAIVYTLDLGPRRIRPGDGSYVYGRLVVQRDDVLFFDGGRPAYAPPKRGSVPNLEADLAADASFRALLRDDRIAAAFFKTANTRYFVHPERSDHVRVSEDEAAEVLRNLRDQNECREDIYTLGNFKGCWPDEIEALKEQSEALEEMLGRPREIPGMDAYLRTSDGDCFLDPDISQENADAFAVIKSNLERLGWTTISIAAQRLKEQQEFQDRYNLMLESRITFLKVCADLERKPEESTPEWAKDLEFVPKKLPKGFLGATRLENTKEKWEAQKTDEIKKRLFNLAKTGRLDETTFNQYLRDMNLTNYSGAKRTGPDLSNR